MRAAPSFRRIRRRRAARSRRNLAAACGVLPGEPAVLRGVVTAELAACLARTAAAWASQWPAR